MYESLGRAVIAQEVDYGVTAWAWYSDIIWTCVQRINKENFVKSYKGKTEDESLKE